MTLALHLCVLIPEWLYNPQATSSHRTHCGKSIQTLHRTRSFACCWTQALFTGSTFLWIHLHSIPTNHTLLGFTTRFRSRTTIPCQISKWLCTAKCDSHHVTNTLQEHHTTMNLAISLSTWAAKSVTEKKEMRRTYCTVSNTSSKPFNPSSSPPPPPPHPPLSCDSAFVPCFPRV